MEHSVFYKSYVVCLCVLLTLSGANCDKLLMLMVDGYSSDFLRNHTDDLPGFKQFFSIGSRAEHVDPQFPTMTFPNYYTLMTGLYPESHGFVGDFMWDELKNESFNMALSPPDIHPHWWEGGEPIWVTAEKQGKRVYLYNWPGCQVMIRGRTPTHCHPYSGDTSVRDGMAHFLSQSEEAIKSLINDKAELAGVYTQIIDQTGTLFGTSGEELKGVLKWIDNEFLRIYYRLEDAAMLDKINIVIMSDRGMAEVTSKKTIPLDKYISSNDYNKILEFGSKVSIWPKEDKLEEVYQKLKTISPHLTVYKKEEIPDEWHHKGHRRVAPIIAVAETGWMIVTPEKRFPASTDGKEFAAFHGFSHTDTRMQAVFVGIGPNFKEGVEAPPFNNVNLYQLMCRILRIRHSPNNGTWDAVSAMFRETPTWTAWDAKIYIALFVAVCVAAGVLNSIHKRRAYKYL